MERKRILALTLVLVMVLSLMPAFAMAEKGSGAVCAEFVADGIGHFTEVENVVWVPEFEAGSSKGPTYLKGAAAVDALSELMESHDSEGIIYYAIPVFSYANTDELIAGMKAAVKALVYSAWYDYEPGNGKSADYCSHNTRSFRYSFNYTVDAQSGIIELDITYGFTYYTTKAQESEIDAAVAELLASLDLDGKSDYEKLRAIYDWICANVTYCNEQLEGSMQHSTYAAIIGHDAVCQGYMTLLYRLCNEVGVMVRCVTSSNMVHGYNIAMIDGNYYYLDSTWDAGEDCYSYFLRGSYPFANGCPDTHEAGDEFADAEFADVVKPVSKTDYALPGYGSECGAAAGTVYQTFDPYTGTLYITAYTDDADGVFYNRSTDTSPWHAYAGEVKNILISSGIDSIDSYAFYDCNKLSYVEMNCDVDSIGSNAFPALDELFYVGCREKWRSVSVGSPNRALDDATVWTYGSHEKDSMVIETEPTPATCTENGARHFVCEYCGQIVPSMDIVLEKLGHDYHAVQVVEPTEYEGGYTVYKCSRCESSYNGDFTDPLHTHDFVPTEVVAPDCNNGGYTVYECSCGLKENRDPVGPLGHSFVDNECVRCHLVKASLRFTGTVSQVKVGSAVVLTLSVDAPSTARVVWTSSNSTVTLSPSADGRSCTVTGASKGSATVTAKLVAADGSALKTDGTTEVSQKLTVKGTSFIDAIIDAIRSFFERIFSIFG